MEKKRKRSKTAAYWAFVKEKDQYYHCKIAGCSNKWDVRSNCGNNIDLHFKFKHPGTIKVTSSETQESIAKHIKQDKTENKPKFNPPNHQYPHHPVHGISEPEFQIAV